MSTFDIFEGSMATTDCVSQLILPGYDDFELYGCDLDSSIQEPLMDAPPSNLGLFSAFMTFPHQKTVEMLALSSDSQSGIKLCDLTTYQPLDSSLHEEELSSSSSSPEHFLPLPVENSLSENRHQSDTRKSSKRPHCEPTYISHSTIMEIRKGRDRQACEPINPNTMVEIASPFFSNGTPQVTSTGNKPRRRVQNARQRKEANVRERKRMEGLNGAFDSLKAKVPTFSYEKRLSRIETLRLATQYISFMTEILSGEATQNGDNSRKTSERENIEIHFDFKDIAVLQSTSMYNLDNTSDSSHSGLTVRDLDTCS